MLRGFFVSREETKKPARAPALFWQCEQGYRHLSMETVLFFMRLPS